MSSLFLYTSQHCRTSKFSLDKLSIPITPLSSPMPTVGPFLIYFGATLLAGNACGSLLGLTLGAKILSNILT